MARTLIILACTSHPCLIHKLAALFSPAHLSLSRKFPYKHSFSIPSPPEIASFFHLICNFLTLLSEKRSFLETILLPGRILSNGLLWLSKGWNKNWNVCVLRRHQWPNSAHKSLQINAHALCSFPISFKKQNAFFKRAICTSDYS